MNSTTANRFSWNAGGLAGAAIGAGAWMPAAALASGWPAIGTVAAFTLASLILVCAYVLWRSRHRLNTFTGLMVLLAVCFLATLSFFAVAHVLDLSMMTSWPEGKSGYPRSYAWVLFIYPVLAGWFWWLNHRRQRQQMNR
jgi:glucan phosphoethanolaminetransferase (alkaline phosphatase superfamily)